jgi:tetratricopeptide (TPR) repeat protein
MDAIWFKRFERELLPIGEKGKDYCRRVSNLLINEEYDRAALLAREGLKKYRGNLMLMGQLGVALGALGDYKGALKLFKRAMMIEEPSVDGKEVIRYSLFSDEKLKVRESELPKYMAHAFTLLAIADGIIIESIKKDDGTKVFKRTKQSSFLDDKDLKLFGKTMDIIRKSMKKIAKKGEFLTCKRLANLMISDVSMVLSHDGRAGYEFMEYLKNDENYELIYTLYTLYGKYYGY